MQVRTKPIVVAQLMHGFLVPRGEEGRQLGPNRL